MLTWCQHHVSDIYLLDKYRPSMFPLTSVGIHISFICYWTFVSSQFFTFNDSAIMSLDISFYRSIFPGFMLHIIASKYLSLPPTPKLFFQVVDIPIYTFHSRQHLMFFMCLKHLNVLTYFTDGKWNIAFCFIYDSLLASKTNIFSWDCW